MLSRLLLILVGLGVALVWRLGPAAVDPVVRIAAASMLFVLLAALEPMLVVLVAAEVGVRIGSRGEFGYALGVTAATVVMGYALARWRQRPIRLPVAVPLLVVSLFALRDPWALLNIAAGASLTWIGAAILLPTRAVGAPNLRSLLGGALVFLHGLLLQLWLIWILDRLLRWPLPRVRGAARRGMHAMYRWFPYGRFDLGALDLTKPVVVVSNHQSSLDIILVLGFPGDVRLTTSPRVWDEPWLGFSARRLGHLRVDDDLLEACRAVAAQGASIHFFPEGTRSRDGYPARFRRGAFELAVQLGLDVLPVIICDSRIFVPRDAYWVDWAHLVVRGLPSVAPGDDSRVLQKRVQAMLREGFTREMARINTAPYLRRKVRRFYRYQGWRVLRAVTAQLQISGVPERPAEEPVRIESGGHGVAALLLAECYPGIRIEFRESNPHKLAVARHAAASHPRVSFEPRD